MALRRRRLVRVAQLCKTRQSGSCSEHLSFPDGVAGYETRHLGSSADQTHLAAQHVPELWQFIDLELANIVPPCSHERQPQK